MIENKGALRFLEVGCGPGHLLHLLEQWYPDGRLFGVDYDNRLLQFAQKKTESVHLIQANAEQVPVSRCRFDVVIALHLVEHLYRPMCFLKQTFDLLKAEGILVVATPNPSGVGARVMRDEWQGWRYDHVSLYSPQRWGRMIEGIGFEQLYSGTTLLSGIPLFRRFPFSLLNYVPLLLFGALPWQRGESLISVFRRPAERTSKELGSCDQSVIAGTRASVDDSV
jgi:SAM-dependent methyltransferase